jgi:hypothetical protein
MVLLLTKRLRSAHAMRKDSLMKSQTKTAMKIFGGAAAVAVAVGLGGVGVDSLGTAPTAGHLTSSVTQAPPPSGSATGSGSGVHVATLTGCISGLDC